MALLRIVAACSDDLPAPPDRVLGRQEFIELGDRACDRYHRQAADVARRQADGRLPDPERMQSSPRQMLKYLNKDRPVYENLLEYFEALRPPPDGQELARGLIDLLQAQVDDIDEAREAKKQGELSPLDPGPLEGRKGFLVLGNRMRRYGFSVCGKKSYDRE